MKSTTKIKDFGGQGSEAVFPWGTKEPKINSVSDSTSQVGAEYPFCKAVPGVHKQA
jgi:hypothetical protein